MTLQWSEMTREDYTGTTAPLFDLPAAAPELAAPGTLFEPEPFRVYVIPCSGAKLDHAAPARELYTGPMFRYALAAAESTGAHVLILSAKHGLVELDTELAPYDARMAPHKVLALGRKMIDQAAGLGLANAAEVFALLPNDYLGALEIALRPLGVGAVNLYQGCRGIGHQRAVLRQLLAEFTAARAEEAAELADQAPAAAPIWDSGYMVADDAQRRAEESAVRCWCCAHHGLEVDAALGRSTCVGCAMRSPSACARKHAAELADWQKEN